MKDICFQCGKHLKPFHKKISSTFLTIQGVPTRFLILCQASMASTLMVTKKLWYKYIQYMRKFDLITINEKKKLTVNIVKI